MGLSTLEIDAPHLRSGTEIMPKSPFLCGRSPTRYDFSRRRKSSLILYSANIALLTVQPGKPRTLENISGLFIVLWPITAKMKTRELPTKPQTNQRSCLRFGFLAPDCLVSCNTITFQKYFWSHGFPSLTVTNQVAWIWLSVVKDFSVLAFQASVRSNMVAAVVEGTKKKWGGAK